MPVSAEPVYPLTKAEFIEALAHGLGRALIHAERHGTNEVRDAILEAALFPKGYDTQCNGYGEKWLARLCGLAGLVETIISGSHGIKGGDAALRCALLKEFAQQGHAAARPALREMCRYDKEWGDLLARSELVEAEGEEGFLFAADRTGARILEDPEYWVDSALISMMDEKAGEGRAMALLDLAGHGNPRIAAYRDALLEMAAKSERREKPPRPTTEEIIGMIFSAKCRPGLIHLGKKATADERRRVASLDFATLETRSLENFLSYFQRTGFPEFREEYLPLLWHPDEQVRWRAHRVLSHHEDPALRKAAHEARERGETDFFLLLLRNSGLPEDTEPLLQAISAPENPDDADGRHGIGSCLLGLVETNQRMDDVRLPAWIYRYSPCMTCRRGAVEVMAARSVFPGWMVEECLADADDHIRKVAADKKGTPVRF